MKKNVGIIDKSIRIIVALIMAGLYFSEVVTGTAGVVLLVLSGIFLVTGFLNFCPIYKVLGIRTNQ